MSSPRSFSTLLPSLPDGPRQAGKAVGALKLFALAFACYLTCAFMIMRSGYLDAQWITHLARSSEYGLIFDMMAHGIHPNSGMSVLWLLSRLSGLPASVLLYVLPAAAGAFLAAWVHARLPAHANFSTRTLCCFIFTSPAALAQFATGSAQAIKVLLMTAAVSVVVSLFRDRQPRRYLAFGALLAMLVVVEPDAPVAVMLLLPPYLLCGMSGRGRNEWITHIGLALFPLLSTLAALTYFSWILQQYMPSMALDNLPFSIRPGHDASPGLPASSSVVPLLLAACWFRGRCGTRRIECIWGIICCTYFVSLLLLCLSPDKRFYLGELQAYGFAITIAALAHAPLHGAWRQAGLCLCLFVALAFDWGWEQGDPQSGNDRWRQAIGTSFSTTAGIIADVLPDLVSRSFATTVTEPDRGGAGLPVAAPASPRSRGVHDYFARHGVQVDRLDAFGDIASPNQRP